jgi:hypothetical protein
LVKTRWIAGAARFWVVEAALLPVPFDRALGTRREDDANFPHPKSAPDDMGDLVRLELQE